jgi:hypothetical protein
MTVRRLEPATEAGTHSGRECLQIPPATAKQTWSLYTVPYCNDWWFTKR